MKKSFIRALFRLLLVFIITIPSFISILNSSYFSMHDDQHIARLYLLVTGIEQGTMFPRWVDMLGFGHGYPLFNFYPPLIYYVSSIFYFFGFSLIWSIKLMLITGFFISALGAYLFIKKLVGQIPALLGTTVYTYFLYHSVTVYVRGAFAEFFTLAILPFVFLSLYKLADETNRTNWTNGKNLIFFGLSFALLILTHPLIAFPSLIFVGLFFAFLFVQSSYKLRFFLSSLLGGILSLGLSAFFWLPSMVERKYTLIDNILTKELASYKDYYVYLSQFWYSPWGYGGSTPGPGDGLTFQLGKVPILFVCLSVILGGIYFLIKKRAGTRPAPTKNNETMEQWNNFIFFFFSFLLSLFMMTSYSSFIWDRVQFLSYIQFPWRFLTFTNLFVAILSAFAVFFFKEILVKYYKKNNYLIVGSLVFVAILVTIYKYSIYFKPQKLIETNDRERTSFKEIAWRISSTSYEFVPKSVKTKKTSLGTTTLAINENELTQDLFTINSGQGTVETVKNLFNYKEFDVQVQTPLIFQLNTYNFPGWQAKLDGKIILINDHNDLKLINVVVPEGNHNISFSFDNTPVRKVGNIITVITLIVITLGLFL